MITNPQARACRTGRWLRQTPPHCTQVGAAQYSVVVRHTNMHTAGFRAAVGWIGAAIRPLQIVIKVGVLHIAVPC